MKFYPYIPLFESDLLYEWVEKIRPSYNDLHEELKTMYEWEYKLNHIKNKTTRATPKRFDNIIKELSKRLTPILDSVISKLDDVFSDWLEFHAITSPRDWARKRYNEEDESILYTSIAEAATYGNNGRVPSEDKFAQYALKFIDMSLDYFEYEIKEYIDSEIEFYGGELANTEEDTEEYEEIEKNIADLEDNLKNTEEYVRDYWGIEEFAEYMGFTGGYQYNYNNHETLENVAREESVIEFNEKVVFPLWFGHWKKKGIVNTRKNVESSYKGLVKAVKEKDLSKKIGLINIALNTSHQTGSMMDYVSSQHDVSEDDLDELSNTDNNTIREWEKDVVEMGI